MLFIFTSQLSVYMMGKCPNPGFIRLLQIKLCTDFRLQRSELHYANNIYLTGNIPEKLTASNYKWGEIVYNYSSCECQVVSVIFRSNLEERLKA